MTSNGRFSSVAEPGSPHLRPSAADRRASSAGFRAAPAPLSVAPAVTALQHALVGWAVARPTRAPVALPPPAVAGLHQLSEPAALRLVASVDELSRDTAGQPLREAAMGLRDAAGNDRAVAGEYCRGLAMWVSRESRALAAAGPYSDVYASARHRAVSAAIADTRAAHADHLALWRPLRAVARVLVPLGDDPGDPVSQRLMVRATEALTASGAALTTADRGLGQVAATSAQAVARRTRPAMSVMLALASRLDGQLPEAPAEGQETTVRAGKHTAPRPPSPRGPG